MNLGTAGRFGSEPLIRILRAGADVLPAAVRYLRLTFVGLRAITLALLLSAVFRGAGSAMVALWLA